jgi:hypothetical protein
MSFINANLPIQIGVSNYVRNDKRVPFIDFVVAASDANTTINIQPTDYQYAQGKVRNLKAILYAPICDVEGDCATSICESGGDKQEPSIYFFDLEECFATKKIQIYEDDIRYLDTGWSFSNNALQQIAAMMPAVRQGIAEDMLIKMESLVGIHPDGATSKRVNLVNPVTLGAYAQGLDDIYLDYSDAGLYAPFIIGGRSLKHFTRRIENGGVNALGDRIDLYEHENIWYDEGLSARVLNDTVNGDHIYSVDPRVFKFVTFSRNAGMFRTDRQSLDDLDLMHNSGNQSYIKGVYLDPVTGLLFDLYIKYDCDNWTIQLKLIWDMWVLPEYVCTAVGVNGIMKWRTCPQVIVPCPTGSLVPSPAAPQQYSWTPDLPCAYPYSIIQGSLENRNSQLDTQVTNIAGLVGVLNEIWGQPIFALNGGGTAIVYSGVAPITGSLNGGEVTITFA